ncbi:hypothetical protein BH10PAT1_BH10PAT1_2270 [soil metagenome]
MHNKIKKDKYSKARGGSSKLLDILCAECGSHVCFYQKDGPGLLKRMYLDRISNSKYEGMQSVIFNQLPQFNCPHCNSHLGTPMIYEKEDRLAFRIFIGSISKKLVKD